MLGPSFIFLVNVIIFLICIFETSPQVPHIFYLGTNIGVVIFVRVIMIGTIKKSRTSIPTQ